MGRGLHTSRMPMAIATYLPKHYPRLLATAEDASESEATWQEWHQGLQETRQKMAALDMPLVEVTVDLDALERYTAHVLSEQLPNRTLLDNLHVVCYSCTEKMC